MTTTTKSSFLSRQSTAKIGLIALGLILLSVVIAAYPTFTFVRSMVIESLHPIALFESGEEFAFVDQDPYSDYLLSMTVTERDAALPAMEISMLNADGAVTGTPMNRWNSVMGREYKQFLRIPAQADGKLTIRVDTPENEDFLIFRRIPDVIAQARSNAFPLWMTSLIPLVFAVALLGIILLRSINDSSNIRLHVSS